MQAYLDLVRHVLDTGARKSPADLKTTKGRTGTPTISCFGAHYKIDLAKGFPLLTTKKVYFKGVLHELLWFLTGETHIRNLKEHTRIWNDWTGPERNWELGRTYGAQWVAWEQYLVDPETGRVTMRHLNQVQDVINRLNNDPYSRRMVVSAWNPADFERPEGDPRRTVQPSACHTMFMFYVSPDRKLSCHLTQRSADLMLGVPFNIASYAVLTQMLAQECGYGLGEFSHYINDCHIYENHVEGAREQLRRIPGRLPELRIARKPFWDLRYEDFELVGYDPQPGIKFEISV